MSNEHIRRDGMHIAYAAVARLRPTSRPRSHRGGSHRASDAITPTHTWPASRASLSMRGTPYVDRRAESSRASSRFAMKPNHRGSFPRRATAFLDVALHLQARDFAEQPRTSASSGLLAEAGKRVFAVGSVRPHPPSLHTRIEIEVERRLRHRHAALHHQPNCFNSLTHCLRLRRPAMLNL